MQIAMASGMHRKTLQYAFDLWADNTMTVELLRAKIVANQVQSWFPILAPTVEKLHTCVGKAERDPRAG